MDGSDLLSIILKDLLLTFITQLCPKTYQNVQGSTTCQESSTWQVSATMKTALLQLQVHQLDYPMPLCFCRQVVIWTIGKIWHQTPPCGSSCSPRFTSPEAELHRLQICSTIIESSIRHRHNWSLLTVIRINAWTIIVWTKRKISIPENWNNFRCTTEWAKRGGQA